MDQETGVIGKMADYIGQVKEFVVENFLFGEESRIGDDTSFLESGIIDSTGLLDLVGFLEERFGIRVEDEELVPDNMDSLRSISTYLAKKLNGKSGS